ncbi:MAG: archaeosortase/exosortase family protein, partial [Pseudomonadota bacterium]
MPLERAANRIRGVSLSQRVPAVWQEPLAILALSVFVLVALALREWSEMLHQWWNIDTYNHILLVPPIIAWLVSLKSRDLARIAPNAWGPGLALIAAALAMWATGRVT